MMVIMSARAGVDGQRYAFWDRMCVKTAPSSSPVPGGTLRHMVAYHSRR